jgi:hypothetical protein
LNYLKGVISKTNDPLSATRDTGFIFASWGSSIKSIVFGSLSSSSTTVTIGGTGTTIATFVVPEYSFGALAVPGACLIALLIYKRKSLPHFKQK